MIGPVGLKTVKVIEPSLDLDFHGENPLANQGAIGLVHLQLLGMRGDALDAVITVLMGMLPIAHQFFPFTLDWVELRVGLEDDLILRAALHFT